MSNEDIKIKTASGETLIFERLKLKDFDGNYTALMRYYGKVGGLIKQQKRRDVIEKQYKKIVNLYLNYDVTQAKIAEMTGISQGYISGFINDTNLKKLKKRHVKNSDLLEVLDILKNKYFINSIFLQHVLENNQKKIDDDDKI